MKNLFDKSKAARRFTNPFSKEEQIGKCNLCLQFFYLPDLEKHTCGTTKNASGDTNSVENDAGSVLAQPDTSGTGVLSEPVCDTETFGVCDPGDQQPE